MFGVCVYLLLLSLSDVATLRGGPLPLRSSEWPRNAAPAEVSWPELPPVSLPPGDLPPPPARMSLPALPPPAPMSQNTETGEPTLPPVELPNLPAATEATEPETRTEVVDALRRLTSMSNTPTGFAGHSRVPVRSGNNDEYDTVEDRWRLGFPTWDRYDKGHPRVFDYPYTLGALFDPFRQNVLKGDYPVYGQNTFLNVGGSAGFLFEGRSLPTAASPPLPGTPRPIVQNFYSRDGQFVHSELYTLSFDLFHGDTAFKPADWRVRLTPAFGLNDVSAQTIRVVSPNAGVGDVLVLGRVTLQEWFAEYKIAELSSAYDFVSIRAGSQPFTSDFRGFIYSDVNRGVRLFGNADANRTQYNLAYFRQLDKDSATQLNTFRDRDQNIAIANIYRQDFLFPGYNISGSFHYNNDGPDIQTARNGALVRPDPVGARLPHRVEAYYLGLAGDGHIDRLSVSHAFYWVLGHDSMNPLAGRPQSISAGMAALELSYTVDWMRFRTSGFWASGDGNARDGRAHGFDSILDNTNFGGAFSFWRRQRIPLFGVGLPNDQSLYPDMRSSRIQGQGNFVNPGLWMLNGGIDFEVTPALRFVNNANVLWFDKTNALETFTQLGHINNHIGVDLSSGWEYRPRLNNNCIFTGGLSTLIPGAGLRKLYNPTGTGSNLLLSAFVEMSFAF